jgi:hypothetical protein
MRYRLLDQRGQVTVLAALLLPAMLVASLGALEAANAYRQNLALQRAASAAARAVADRATATDLSAPEPPTWMEEEARRIAEEALGPDLAPERVTVRWADEAGTVPAPGRSYSLDVTVPDFITSSTTLRWGDPHSFNYLVPQFVTQAAQRWASFSFRHEDTWLDPGRRSGDVSHSHGYQDYSYDCPYNCWYTRWYGVGTAWRIRPDLLDHLDFPSNRSGFPGGLVYRLAPRDHLRMVCPQHLAGRKTEACQLRSSRRPHSGSALRLPKLKDRNGKRVVHPPGHLAREDRLQPAIREHPGKPAAGHSRPLCRLRRGHHSAGGRAPVPP